MAGSPDVIRFDSGLGRIYAACCSGAISVFHQDAPQHYRKLEDFKVQHAVHSLAVDPTDKIVGVSDQGDGAIDLIAGSGSGLRTQVLLSAVERHCQNNSPTAALIREEIRELAD